MNKFELHKEISSMSKELRYSIQHSMPKQYKMDIGIEILQCMRRLKLLACNLCYDIISEEFFRANGRKELIHLTMLIDECIEDKILLTSGPYTIILPRKRLMNLYEDFNITKDIQQ